MVDASMSAGKPCCGQGTGASTIMLPAQGGSACIQPPDVVGAQGGSEDSRATGSGGGGLQLSSNNMTPEEQMRFFQSLSLAPK